MVPSYLLSSLGCEFRTEGFCRNCAEAVKQNPETGRWFITMGHPGFNSYANNGRGYASQGAARRSIGHFADAARRGSLAPVVR